MCFELNTVLDDEDLTFDHIVWTLLSASRAVYQKLRLAGVFNILPQHIHFDLIVKLELNWYWSRQATEDIQHTGFLQMLVSARAESLYDSFL